MFRMQQLAKQKWVTTFCYLTYLETHLPQMSTGVRPYTNESDQDLFFALLCEQDLEGMAWKKKERSELTVR